VRREPGRNVSVRVRSDPRRPPRRVRTGSRTDRSSGSSRAAGRRPEPRGPPRLALLPTAALRVRRSSPGRWQEDRRTGRRVVPVLPGPRDRPLRRDPGGLEGAIPGLLHHRAGQQRRHRSHQRHHRAASPHRPWLPQPRQLPPQNDLGCREAHPPETPMSPQTTPSIVKRG
jgi:hypothetical protein